MIQANELRFGSRVIAGNIHEGAAMQVSHLLPDKENNWIVFFIGFETGEYIKDVTPITLTPEILERFGFKKSNEFDHWYLIEEGLTLTIQKDSCWWWTIDDMGDNEGSHLRKIKFLHQLQNLYFALTNTELSFTQ